jgi:hypothetical protein
MQHARSHTRRQPLRPALAHAGCVQRPSAYAIWIACLFDNLQPIYFGSAATRPLDDVGERSGEINSATFDCTAHRTQHTLHAPRWHSATPENE